MYTKHGAICPVCSPVAYRTVAAPEEEADSCCYSYYTNIIIRTSDSDSDTQQHTALQAASDSDSNKSRPQVAIVSIYIMIIRNIHANKAFLPCGQHIYTSKLATVTGCSKHDQRNVHHAPYTMTQLERRPPTARSELAFK